MNAKEELQEAEERHRKMSESVDILRYNFIGFRDWLKDHPEGKASDGGVSEHSMQVASQNVSTNARPRVRFADEVR